MSHRPKKEFGDKCQRCGTILAPENTYVAGLYISCLTCRRQRERTKGSNKGRRVQIAEPKVVEGPKVEPVDHSLCKPGGAMCVECLALWAEVGGEPV